MRITVGLLFLLLVGSPVFAQDMENVVPEPPPEAAQEAPAPPVEEPPAVPEEVAPETVAEEKDWGQMWNIAGEQFGDAQTAWKNSLNGAGAASERVAQAEAALTHAKQVEMEAGVATQQALTGLKQSINNLRDLLGQLLMELEAA